MNINTLLVFQAIATFMMTGLIWVVQLVIYPLFTFIDDSSFQNYHREYALRITWVVLPLMFSELLLSIVFLYELRDLTSLALFILVLLLWGCTFFLSVPCHQSLEAAQLHMKERLIQTNWPRTILWSIRTIVLSYLLMNMN